VNDLEYLCNNPPELGGIKVSGGGGGKGGDVDTSGLTMALNKLRDEMKGFASQKDLANLNDSLRDELNRKADK